MGANSIPDFGGWATKADLECTDGLTIGSGAFAHQDGKKVPLVWSHKHDDPELVLGHAILKNRDGHTYSDLYFNPKSPKGLATKFLIEHDDLDSLSIWANQLKKVGKKVVHGMIREVSVVLAGANPGAKIDFVNLAHSDWDDDFEDESALITMGFKLEHDGVALESEVKKEEVAHAASTKSAQDVYESMTEEQQALLHQSVAAVLAGEGDSVEQSADAEDDTNIEHKEGNEQVKTTRIFEQGDNNGGAGGDVLAHSDILVHGDDATVVAMRPGQQVVHVQGNVLNEIFQEARDSRRSMRQVAREYARSQDELQHGITNLELLFPDAKTVDNNPQLLKRRTEWVNGVLSGVTRRPFSRVKTIWADLTEEEARARGHIKGNLKVEEYFGLAKRSTSATMVYKKQKLDREDILEITEYNVVAFMKGEMRLMLDEEIARAILIGDGRSAGDDKIKDPGGAVTEGAGIRAIYNDHELFAPKVFLNLQDSVTRGEASDKIGAFLDEHYKGSGGATFYTTLPKLGKMLRERDADGRRLYRDKSELASEIGVSNIVTVEVMESIPSLVGIVVNLSDYGVGTNAGGEVTLFDDFDIDYNQEKFLIETFLSGALMVLKSAVVIIDAGVANAAAAVVTPTVPTFDEEAGELTIVNTTGVVYTRTDTDAVVNAGGSPYTIAPGASITVVATPSSNAYYLEDNVDDQWTFTADE